MKKPFLYSVIGFFILIYFIFIVVIFPNYYLSVEPLVSQPYFEVTISESEISLGDSFDLDLVSENKGEYGDIHILSVGFPNLDSVDDSAVLITTYDFTQSLVYFLPGDQISAGYSGGVISTVSEYPSIEAMSRPVLPNAKNHLSLSITPDYVGTFVVYVKTINIPHIDSRSHYPQSGILDQQDEYVMSFSVNVIP